MAEKNEKKSILLRLSPHIWEEINCWAEEEFRSVNGQIEYLLQDAINRRRAKPTSPGKDEKIEYTGGIVRAGLAPAPSTRRNSK
jgi:hypothetical protein